jgi:hypothetical protein
MLALASLASDTTACPLHRLILRSSTYPIRMQPLNRCPRQVDAGTKPNYLAICAAAGGELCLARPLFRATDQRDSSVIVTCRVKHVPVEDCHALAHMFIPVRMVGKGKAGQPNMLLRTFRRRLVSWKD